MPIVRNGLLVLVAAVTVTTLSAQRRGGSPVDAPEVQGHRNDVDSTYTRLPLAPEDLPYGRIDGASMKADVNAITAISRRSRDQGIKYWGRIAGSTADLEVEA